MKPVLDVILSDDSQLPHKGESFGPVYLIAGSRLFSEDKAPIFINKNLGETVSYQKLAQQILNIIYCLALKCSPTNICPLPTLMQPRPGRRPPTLRRDSQMFSLAPSTWDARVSEAQQSIIRFSTADLSMGWDKRHGLTSRP